MLFSSCPFLIPLTPYFPFLPFPLPHPTPPLHPHPQAAAASQDIDNLRCDPSTAPSRRCGDPSTDPALELTRVTYALKTVLVAGQCFQNAGAGRGHLSAPPNGLQLALYATQGQEGQQGLGRRAVSDTLVMQNLGYYQLQVSGVHRGG